VTKPATLEEGDASPFEAITEGWRPNRIREDQMLYRLRQCPPDEGGFTLIELLVVILIIGILAAIAIPAFLSQTSKASDSAAKTQVGTLQTTIKVFAAEHGSYTGATLGALQIIEPTLKDTTTVTAQPVVVEAGGEGFEVSSTAKGTGDVYKLASVKGAITRTCTIPAGAPNTGGGCKAGSW
jgi:type IV pilus assembly protein PilA